MKPEELKKLEQTINLLSLMTISGDMETDQSRLLVRQSRKIINDYKS